MDMQYCPQSTFGPVFNFSHGQGMPMQYPEEQYAAYPGFHGLQYMYHAQQARHLGSDRNSMSDGKTESKPRLSKEEVEKLEKVFQENPKPSSSVKAALADGLGLERPRINNWFQNRRAKAKQERKQEEYEARRAAEKSASESTTPEGSRAETSDAFDDSPQQSVRLSSAPFPDMNSAVDSTESYDDDDDEDQADIQDDENPTPSSEGMEPHFASHPIKVDQESNPVDLQSPMSLGFSPSDQMAFNYSHLAQDYTQQGAIFGYNGFVAPPTQSLACGLNQETVPASPVEGLSPDQNMASTDFRNGLRLQMGAINTLQHGLPACEGVSPVEPQQFDEASTEQTQSAMQAPESMPRPLAPQMHSPQDTPAPSDSFKSPPPPANIASRRNIPRPAALQVRSRPFNLQNGPKTSMDGPRRNDPSSPATAMRRIASASGNMPGRIQKQSAGPRSPMFFGRNTETYLQYHARSPVGSMMSNLTAGAPPTPMTPVVYNQQGMREPTVSSNCSDDETLMLGAHSGAFGLGTSLKTPPGTPGMLGNFASSNLGVHPLSAGLDFSTDQPLLTPHFQTEFPDLSMHNIPSYVELNDNSLPSTPLYPNMAGCGQDSLAYVGGGQANQQQFDWETNESISSRSSPGQSRSKQIHFTQNMTPQDYNLQEN
ncbi:homeobox transcription [Apiospora marii]|uniref:Homeobox transcription n=1 Tax=Apiospora marii TaxID=335849 RepID=A0ABR1SFU7_9PEZI